VPTGGINQDNAHKFLEAGAVALGIGGNLVSKTLLASENYPLITETARFTSPQLYNLLISHIGVYDLFYLFKYTSAFGTQPNSLQHHL
jgi:hypothetical protein